MCFRFTSRGFKSKPFGRSHINPMAPRVGTIGQKVTYGHIKISNLMAHRLSGNGSRCQKMRQTLLTLRHQHMFNAFIGQMKESPWPGQPRTFIFVRNKHKSSSLNDGHHHHSNSCKSRIPLAHCCPYPVRLNATDGERPLPFLLSLSSLSLSLSSSLSSSAP